MNVIDHKGFELKDVTVILSQNDAGQLLEGIEVLIEQWDATAEYLSTGLVPDGVCIREAQNAHEAESIAATYRSLMDRIDKQVHLAR